jgi:hypothetical protein
LSTLFLLTDAAKNDGAVCIDGTPAGYYFRAGTGSGITKWYIHHEGGGWCSSLQDCYGRSLTPLGSSKNYTPTANIDGGYFSTDPNINPLMYNWNSVYLKYCDGGSFSGDNATTSNYNGQPLLFRGRRILNAMFGDLYNVRGLSSATDAVISGCSAGGLATYLHLDWWRAQLPSKMRVVGMPDSGFFLDFEGPPQYHSKMIWTFTWMNATSGVNDKCIASYQRNGEEWHCFFAQHTSPFITTPIFPLQSEYDSWQVSNDLGSNNPTAVNSYGRSLVDLVRDNLLAPHAADSVFLDSCYHHCGGWNSIHINGLTQAQAFKLWYEGSKTEWFQDQTYPCETCCS